MVSANILLTEVKTEVIQGSPKMEGTKPLTCPRMIKMTQINFTSRNQLHNTANKVSCQSLNFGLNWPG